MPAGRRGGGRVKSQPLTAAALDEVEQLAKTNAAETYRGALLALVAEVRRLRAALNRSELLPQSFREPGTAEGEIA